MRRIGKICLLQCSILLGLAACSTTPGQVKTLADVDPQVRNQDPVYQVMVAEIASQRGDYAVANTLFQKAMYLTNNAKVAEQAMGVAAHLRDYDAMYAAATRWLKLEPGKLQPLRIAAVLSVEANETDAASNFFVQLARQHEDGARAGWKGSYSLLNGAKNKAAALVVAEKLVKAYPKNTNINLLSTFLHIDAGNLAVADQRVSTALALAPNDTDVIAAKAQVEIKAGRRGAAMRLLQDKLAGDGADNHTLRLEYAQLLLQQSQHAKAAQQYRQVLQRQPENAAALFALGQLAGRDKRWSEAQRYYRQLKTVDGYAAAAQYNLGSIAEQKGQYQEAIQHYTKVISGKYALDAQVGVARMFKRLGKVRDARAHLHEVRQRLPRQNARLFDLEGNMFLQEQDPETALVVYSEALELHPKVTDLYYGRSVVWSDMGMPEQALIDLEKALDLSPNDPNIMNAIGYTLTFMPGRYEEAETYIDKALALLPEAPSVLDSKGWVLFRQGKLQESLAYLQRAHTLHKDPEIAAHLGEVLWALGRKEQAKTVWQATLNAEHPNNRLVKETMERLLK